MPEEKKIIINMVEPPFELIPPGDVAQMSDAEIEERERAVSRLLGHSVRIKRERRRP